MALAVSAAALYRAAAACRDREAGLISGALEGKLDQKSDWKLAGRFL